MGQYKISNQKKRTYSVSSKKNCINKGDITSYWVVHSKIKELDVNNLFERKQMIEVMKAELTGSLKNFKC